MARPGADLVAEARDVPGRVAAAARLPAARVVVLRPDAVDRPVVAPPDAGLSELPGPAAAEAGV
ncbi:hypothetical protein ND748_21650, partial [Frankia sp. AiPs1]